MQRPSRGKSARGEKGGECYGSTLVGGRGDGRAVPAAPVRRLSWAGWPGFRLYALRRREERERALREEWERERESAERAAPPPPPNSAPKNVYYIVEKKRDAPPRGYAEPREIKF